MVKNSNILVVIPIHEWNQQVAEFTTVAIRSVEEQTHKCDMIVVCPPNVEDKVLEYLGEVNIFQNIGPTDVVTQCNHGLKFAVDMGYEWVSILEFDDYYDNKWAELLLAYAEYKVVDFILPISMFENSNNQFIGFFNEAAWANGVSEKHGYYDLLCLMNRNFIHLFAGMIRTSALVDFGFLKQLDIVSTFEFSLRMVYNGVEPFVVPKILHHHLMNRPNSYTEMRSKIMTKEEFVFWNDTARKQYFFPEDRNIVYESTQR